jgi:hypothetical protein
LPDQWKESVIVPVHKKGDRTDCNNYHGIPLLATSYKIVSNILPRLDPYIYEIIGVNQCVIDQLLIKFSAFIRYWRKKWEYIEAVHQLSTDFKKAGNFVNVLIEFGGTHETSQVG